MDFDNTVFEYEPLFLLPSTILNFLQHQQYVQLLNNEIVRNKKSAKYSDPHLDAELTWTKYIEKKTQVKIK